MGFLLVNNSTRSQALFFYKDAISSTMASFHSFPSSEYNASLIVLGSSLVIDKSKFEQKENELHLSGFLLSWTDLLKVGVCGSSSFESCSTVDSNSSSFSSKSISQVPLVGLHI